MRIAFVSTMASVPWGGSELLWSEAACRLSAMKHTVYASVPQWPQTPEPIRQLRSKFGIHLWERPQIYPVYRRFFQKLLSFRSENTLLNSEMTWLRKIKPDLLCISSGNALEGVEWMRLAHTVNIPYVTIAQAHVEFLWPPDDQLESLRNLFSNSLRCFFVSKANLDLLETQIAHSLENAEIVFNPFNVSKDAKPSWPKLINGTWQLACVGRLHPPSKGQDLLLGVLNSTKWKVRPVQVSFYGKGPHEKGLRSLADKFGLQEKVIFQGHVNNIEKIWQQNHALVLPSRYEGLPLAIVEALMCGRPVITTNVAGNANLLEEGLTGYVAEAPTIFHLSKAMENAWEARHHWQEMGQYAQKEIHRKIPEDSGIDFARKLLELATSI